MTIGKWRDTIALSSKAFTGYDGSLLAAISGLRIGVSTSGFSGDIEEFVQARNEWIHMRDSSLLDDIIEATQARSGRLRRCMEALGFLGEYPIQRIQRPPGDRSGEWQLERLCYRGDHPSLSWEIVRFRGDLPAGELNEDLFLNLGGEHWVSLHPFITV